MKISACGQPSESKDCKPWIKNTDFNPRLVEFADAKPRSKKANCILLKKNLHVSGPAQFKPVSFKGHLYREDCTSFLDICIYF